MGCCTSFQLFTIRIATISRHIWAEPECESALHRHRRRAHTPLHTRDDEYDTRWRRDAKRPRHTRPRLAPWRLSVGRVGQTSLAFEIHEHGFARIHRDARAREEPLTCFLRYRSASARSNRPPWPVGARRSRRRPGQAPSPRTPVRDILLRPRLTFPPPPESCVTLPRRVCGPDRRLTRRAVAAH